MLIGIQHHGKTISCRYPTLPSDSHYIIIYTQRYGKTVQHQHHAIAPPSDSHYIITYTQRYGKTVQHQHHAIALTCGSHSNPRSKKSFINVKLNVDGYRLHYLETFCFQPHYNLRNGMAWYPPGPYLEAFC